MIKIYLKIITCCIFLISNVEAQAQHIEQVSKPMDRYGWKAVGRLSIGRSFCTGSLIAHDLVLTAAHCVYDVRTQQPKPISTMRFLAGYHKGAAVEKRQVVGLAIPENYRPETEGTSRAKDVRFDVAVLKLDRGIYINDSPPFILERNAPKGTSLTLASYGRGRSEQLQLEHRCDLKQRYDNGMMTFSCQSTFGSSGSPVFANDSRGLRIVSVISGGNTHNNEKISVGMELPSVVQPLIAQARGLPTSRSTPKVRSSDVTIRARRLTVGASTGTSQGGALFVRP